MRFAIVWLFAMLTWPATADASGRTCEYDLECPAAHACGADGLCYHRGMSTSQQPSADALCDADRRCRIDRLAERRRSTRQARALGDAQNVEAAQEAERQRLRGTQPRKAKPLSVGWRVSRLGPVGGAVGYTLFGRLQPNFEVAYSNNIWTSDGWHEIWWFRLGGSYLLLDGPFSPYLTAGFMVGAGRHNAWYTSTAKTVLHAGELGGGLDMQAKVGLTSRLGVVYRPRIYSQVKQAPGVYEVAARTGLNDWFAQHATVDVVWTFGWAF